MYLNVLLRYVFSDCPCGSYCVSGENVTCSLGSSDEEDCECKAGQLPWIRFTYFILGGIVSHLP